MRKNKFFDTIMIALILMIGFRIIFPGAFPGNPDTPDNPDNPGIDTSHMVDLPVFADVAALKADGRFFNYLDSVSVRDDIKIVDGSQITAYFDGQGTYMGPIYFSAEVVHVDKAVSIGADPDEGQVDTRENYDSRGIPAFYIGDSLYYLHLMSWAPEGFQLTITTPPADCSFIAPYTGV